MYVKWIEKRTKKVFKTIFLGRSAHFKDCSQRRNSEQGFLCYKVQHYTCTYSNVHDYDATSSILLINICMYLQNIEELTKVMLN